MDKSYVHTTEVEVPPFSAIMVEAIITRAELTVPWEATIKTALGTIQTISGTWYGVSTYNLYVKQTDL